MGQAALGQRRHRHRVSRWWADDGGDTGVGVRGFAGFKGNRVGGQGPRVQGRGDTSHDMAVLGMAVQQKDFDECAGAGGVPVGLAGCRPPRIVGGGERARNAGLLQCGRPGEGAGFADERLQVMVQVQAGPALGQ